MQPKEANKVAEKQKQWKAYHYFGVSIGVHGILCLLIAFSIWLTASKTTSHTTMEVELTEVPAVSQHPKEEKGGGGGGGIASSQVLSPPIRPSLTPISQNKRLFDSQTIEAPTSSGAATSSDEKNTDGASKQVGKSSGSSGSQPGLGYGVGSGTGSGVGTGQGSGVGTGSGSGKGTGTGGGSTIDWRSRFVAQVEQNKTYPFQARRQGITGIVRVRVVISQGGTLLENQVVSSSGDSRLDQAALEAVRASVPFVHEYGGTLSLTIPIRFYLK